jgi:hypothetical protein
MDGLAKVLDRQPQTPDSYRAACGRARTQRCSEQDMDEDLRTQSGQALRTLPYMPPEQARGELERVDES